ncbi:ead/Ea22-like family protein [Escherichia coli]|uniref:ead/Ea22-like family protein n=1 Tax=Escherichia coli TaxID=562 RepID=UPI000542AB08|nr:ead/Ea22-like family protein [Escherichia coli]EEQ7075101.1 ead/Ea22-like family protein [Escherichia coli]EES2227820.1 ead/Ea22-like family protein [Escherichia coli]EEU0084242.1 ead/Ea22-like family protein [Escherichia coli]EEU5270492.1 ead/Ea22-like family protein [Escherichia coli]EEW1229481.1 ead/Ea22-like family protein [Escherichia coli]
MSEINYQALREAAVAIETVATPQKLLAFRMKVTPQVVLALLDEREADKKRIAELEAREILLPERSSMLHRTDFHDDYQTVMAYKVSEVIAAIRAAGIRIKGE